MRRRVERDLGSNRGTGAPWARDCEPTAEHLDAVAETAQSRAGAWIGASGAVIGDLYDELPPASGDRDTRSGGVGVLEDVRERLGDQVVRRHLHRFRRSPPGLDEELDRERRSRGQRRERRGETAIAEDGRMDAASEVTQLLQRGGELGASLREQLFLLGAGRQETREQPQPHRERDEPLLGAVVEIALEPPAGTVGGGHQPRAGLVLSPILALKSPSRSAGAPRSHGPRIAPVCCVGRAAVAPCDTASSDLVKVLRGAHPLARCQGGVVGGLGLGCALGQPSGYTIPTRCGGFIATVAGSTTFDEAVSAGRELSLEQAVDYAADVSPP
jgi:hypothetical protein